MRADRRAHDLAEEDLCNTSGHMGAAWRERMTDGYDEHSVQTCACTWIESEDGMCQGDLYHVAEDVDSKAGDDDCADVHASGTGFNGLEYEEAAYGDHRRGPRNEVVYEPA